MRRTPFAPLLAVALATAMPALAQERALVSGDRTYALHFSEEIRLVRSAPATPSDRTAAWEFETDDWRLDSRGKFGVSLGVIESADSFAEASSFYTQSSPGLEVTLSPTTLFVDGRGFHIFVAPSQCPYPCSITLVLGYDETHKVLGQETARLLKADLTAGGFVKPGP